MIKSIFVALAVLFPASGAQAQNRTQVLGGDLFDIQDAVNALNAKAFPVIGLSRGVRELKIVPSYLNIRNNSDFGSDGKLQGGGFAASYFRGLSDHWGYSVIGAFGAVNGDAIGIQEITGAASGGFSSGFTNDFDSGTTVNEVRMSRKGTGWQVATAIVYDPTDPGSRVRLPIMLGFGLMYFSHDLEGTYNAVHSAGQQRNVRLKRRDFKPGFFFGLSVQIDAGPFQIAPFFASQVNLGKVSQDVTVTVASTGAVLYSQNDAETEFLSPSFGIGFTYKPWGLGFSFTPSFHQISSFLGNDGEGGSKVSIISLSKTFNW